MFLHTLVALSLPLFTSLFPFSSSVQPPTARPTEVCSVPGFAGSRVTRTLQSTNDTAVADFNGDGRLDLANQANTAQTLSVQFGTGNGYFGDPVVIDTASSGFYVVAADFNNDGAADLLTNNKIFLGTGTGSFLTPRAHVLSASQLIAADFNRDDNIDIAGQSGRNVEVFFGDGLGSFSSLSTIDFLTGNVNWFTPADMNGDSLPDLVASLAGNTVGVAVASPSGTFGPVSNFAVGGTARLIGCRLGIWMATAISTSWRLRREATLR